MAMDFGQPMVETPTTVMSFESWPPNLLNQSANIASPLRLTRVLVAVSPQRPRAAVRHPQRVFGVGERFAPGVVRLEVGR
jgi:hypothetical protein